MQIRQLFYLVLALFLISCNNQPKSSLSSTENNPKDNYAVASAHPLATQAGIDILNQGGNAFDAAVAVTSVLAVVEPYASGLGGGGFWLLHQAEKNRDVMIDGREVAPLAATRDMYIDANGNATKQSISGPLAAGIPGTPAALAHLADNYGRLPLKTSLQTAIHLARNGFSVGDFYASRAAAVKDRLNSFPHSATIFLQQGDVPQAGYVLKQADLADVLESIAENGADGFYHGKVAKQLVSNVQQAGGIWQHKDLSSYRIIERLPIRGKYKNLEIVSASLPSSGGIVLMQVLNMLSRFDLQKMNQVQRMHIIVEAMRRAYHDRAKYLGDVDFVAVPVEELLSSAHAEERFADFSMQQATASQNYIQNNILETLPLVEEAQNTTHFSILDQHGNKVAATLSINYFFGSGFVAEGTGVLLNNEMDDFAIQPGHANLWGLVGNEANAIEPGKRMLSSMSPTFLFDGERSAILGTPGGSRIISMVLLSALAFSEGASAEQMVRLPRYHHQFLPDEIQFEQNSLDAQMQKSLQTMGHRLKDLGRSYGNMHSIILNQKSKQITAVSDPRGIGKAQTGLGQ